MQRPSKIEVEVTESGFPRQVLITSCCGARLWVHLGPIACPSCGRTLGQTQPTVERTPRRLHTVTRYWS